ncbi:hypothetical protein V501_06938 [Pseudogymnoascus sp. VKM F-4519 (FW-2642)]|nr:hypothetical protein V501_06938 [Pseudogymnoascus sp. VKM F-4519 (FW-2642)]
MLPPTRVQIKRKATEDPVEILRVHDELTRGRNAGQFIFKRQRIVQGSRPNAFTVADSAGYTSALENGPRAPQVKTSQPGDEFRDQPSRNLSNTQPAVPPETRHVTIRQDEVGAVPPANNTGAPDVARLPRVIAEPRRFHLSRKLAHGAGNNNVEGANARRTPGKTNIAVFRERKVIPAAETGPPTDTKIPAPLDVSRTEPQNRTTSRESVKELGKKPSVSLLRLTPVNAVKPRRNSPAPLRGARLPSGDIIPWDASTERLNMEMQAYTLREIRKNLADNNEPQVTVSLKPEPEAPKSPASRFKPRAGAGLRYHERHPDAVTAQGTGADSEMQAMDVDDDDSNYIIETYIRMPVEQALLESNEASIGLLVLDSQPDIDQFYNGDSDSDSDAYDEEEDENAENHPSTDYPDEEVQSDDEYGINPYQYRNRNTSDNEEYDEDDATFSDDELEAKKEPWSRRPWMEAYSGKKEGNDEEEESY